MEPSIVPNARLLYNKIPTGYPIPGETTVYDNTETIDLNAPLNGGILVKVLVLSIDPYQRGRMRDPAKLKYSYSTMYELGKPLVNHSVSIVLRSDHPQFKAGDHVYGILAFQKYIHIEDTSNLTILENKEKLPWSTYVGAAGMPGQTAYMGWKAFSKAKKGETAFITTAGGPVGSLVVQIAKSEGLKVIASAGSDEKVAFAKELGADVAFNYKTKDTAKALEELGHGIDIYWDNVGGATLEAALDALNSYGRVLCCGAISGYNSEPHGVKNLFMVVQKRLILQGFIVTDLLKDMAAEFYDVVPKKIAAGEYKHREHIYRGLQEAGQGIADVQKGENKAKAVVVLADE